MGLVSFGGFIITTKKGNYIGRQKVDDQTLQKVAKLLDIPDADRDKLASGVESVFIYRGTAPPKKKSP